MDMTVQDETREGQSVTAMEENDQDFSLKHSKTD